MYYWRIPKVPYLTTFKHLNIFELSWKHPLHVLQASLIHFQSLIEKEKDVKQAGAELCKLRSSLA